MALGPSTPGEAEILRHAAREFRGADGPSSVYLKQIEDHLGGFLGRNDFVFHEIVSDAVHVDVLEFAPTKEHNVWTFFTCGMSDRPMKVPADFAHEARDLELAELTLSLPAALFARDRDGKIDEASAKRDNRLWPVTWPGYLARFPHKYDTGLWRDHSLPKGEPAKPLGPGTVMCGWVLGAPRTWPTISTAMRAPRLTFHAVFPVYYEEMKFKLNNGSAALFDLFDKNGVTEVLNPTRARVR